ncbi:MAG: ABC-F family ATP-binding cassette domain-containing protein [Verrucomicrobiales bacterium]|nr:ABC-F family ATP-binding cassette domain-containing protein [Verrucomicrobiales bacterium]
MLTFAGLTKSFAGRTLFAEATLSLVKGDRVAVVGPNGAGKSTLFRILLGQETADVGEVTWGRGTRLGYLPQESEPAGDETVLEIALGLTHAGTRRPAGDDRELVDVGDGPHPDHAPDGETVARAKQILAGLAFRQTDFDRPAKQMSGGWVMRAHLARLLVQEPDLLMLDEPTNHLDLEALLWVQEYLRAYPGSMLLISHDREFLNQLCTHVVELRQTRLLKYTGNFDRFIEQRAALEETLEATWKAQQREIDRLQRFVDRFRAKNTKAAQAQSKLKQIERLKEEQGEAPGGPEATVGFSFPQPERSGLRVIRLEEVGFAYPGDGVRPPLPVYDALDFEVERGARIVLVGPNGAGKSTLLKLLSGNLTPQAGERRLGHNVHLGYYSQFRTEMLRPERTVLEEAMHTPQRVTETFVRTVLGSFLFRGDDVFKRVSVLSGGEKSRLALVKLLLDPPNFLLMDEPTTHLDMASIDALIEALEPYTGTLVFISHDVHFIRAIANQVIHVRAGRLTPYAGGYDYYLEKTAQAARAGLTGDGPGGAAPANHARVVTPSPGADGTVSRKEQRRLAAEARQAQSRLKREVQQQVKALEDEIAALEVREKELVAELESPATYAERGRAVEINRELAELHERLPGLHTAWEEAATRLLEFGEG